MENKKGKTGLIVFITIIALASLIAVADIFKKNNSSSREERQSKQKAKPSLISILNKKNSGKASSSGKYIARLYITGTIEESNSSYDQEWLLETIDDLLADSDNVGIILSIDSPGGAVYEADEAYLKLMEYKEEKPLYAYFESLAASGGYYIGCAADYIVANRNTLTGSIGVIAGQTLDLTGLMDKYGIKSETVHAGKNKNMGNYNEPFTEEQRAIMQSIADECYEQFTGIVAERRGIPLPRVRDLADGRIYTALQAKNNGLIDAIGSWDNVVQSMCDDCFDGEEIDVEEYSYEPSYNFYSYFRSFMDIVKPSAQSTTEMILEKVFVPPTKFPAYYYEG